MQRFLQGILDPGPSNAEDFDRVTLECKRSGTRGRPIQNILIEAITRLKSLHCAPLHQQQAAATLFLARLLLSETVLQRQTVRSQIFCIRPSDVALKAVACTGLDQCLSSLKSFAFDG